MIWVQQQNLPLSRSTPRINYLEGYFLRLDVTLEHGQRKAQDLANEFGGVVASNLWQCTKRTFRDLYAIHGKNWQAIAKAMKTRDNAQVGAHGRQVYLKSLEVKSSAPKSIYELFFPKGRTGISVCFEAGKCFVRRIVAPVSSYVVEGDNSFTLQPGDEITAIDNAPMSDEDVKQEAMGSFNPSGDGVIELSETQVTVVRHPPSSSAVAEASTSNTNSASRGQVQIDNVFVHTYESMPNKISIGSYTNINKRNAAREAANEVVEKNKGCPRDEISNIITQARKAADEAADATPCSAITAKAVGTKPQRVKSAKQFYNVDEYKNVKTELGLGNSSTKVSRTDVQAELNKRWDESMSHEQKQKYYKMADDDKIRHKKEMDVYKAKQDSENPMSGPVHAGSWMNTMTASPSNLSSAVEREVDGSATNEVEIKRLEMEFGGDDDNDNLFGDDEILDSVEGKESSLKNTPPEEQVKGWSQEATSTAVVGNSLKITAPPADQQPGSRHTEVITNSPTDVFMSTAATNVHEEGAKLPKDVNNPTVVDVEERINNIVTGHQEEMKKHTAHSLEVLKKLKDAKEQILVKGMTSVAKVRLVQYNGDLEKLKNENTSLHAGAERDMLEEKKEKLKSELEKAEKGKIDNAGNQVVLDILQDGIDKKKDDLKEVNIKLDHSAGAEASLKRKYEDIYQQDMKRLKIEEAPVVMNMWSVLSKD